ncbi:alpha-L-rhamnosidase [Cohnella nanjingensis]|uniref:alpha-L-rhamnosidase n=1 Tax=Cohnella nanjingensis TaxID=1387779 RepID=A0A7X0RM70_9BACL|nr:alpha-L-rhamnosidase [Cohnella nanjingensis]MBB6670107.1 family 78 glycoside hydrolase catalytic domain [Cohnella nanjingensis]
MNGVSDWIWRSRRIRVNDFSYFRKEFTVVGELESARLCVSAHHYVQVYVNGDRVGGFGTPAPTDPWKRKLYTEHEIAGLLLKGANCITADAHYLGGGGQNAVDGRPGFRLELHLTYANGKKAVVKTDTSWLALAEMPHRTGTPYQQNRKISAVEDYDARKWQETWRYAGSGHALGTVKVKKAKIGRDEWPMFRQAIPEGAIEEELPLQKLRLPAGTHEDEEMPQVFDAGRIVSGWPKFKLKGIAGATIRLRYSEDLDVDGRVKHNVCNENSAFYYDQYTMRGSPMEEWQPSFAYKAFRYVEVTGYPFPIESGHLTVCAAHTGMEDAGAFRCSDEHLNALYEACIRTQKNNMLGQIVDCPHREQAQYLADTDLQAETLLYNFDAAAILEKTLSDFADAQLEDGTFPFVAPTNYANPDFHIQIPEWDLHYATLLWKLYESTGRKALLETYYEPLRRMIGYFIDKLDPATGLVPLDKGWHISDWPYPSVEHAGEFLTVQQIKLLQALRIASQAAALIGEQKDRACYLEWAERLLDNIVKQLYDEQSGRFKDSSDAAQAHQGVTAIALYADAVPEKDRERAIGYVADKPWECRTVLSLPLLRMLFDNGREAEAFAILSRRAYPGWGYMIAQGAKTMWEGWEDIESHSHAWNGYPARLLQEYVVGIRSEAPGFRKAVIRPYFPESLTFAEAKVWTVQGSLSAGWERLSDGAIRVTASIPPEIEARVEVRLSQTTAVVKLGPGEHDMRFK